MLRLLRLLPLLALGGVLVSGPVTAQAQAGDQVTIVDFDYQARIQEAQGLVAKQPVLPGDIQVEAGQLSHFVWTLAVGAPSGPLKIVRMDEQLGGWRHGTYRSQKSVRDKTDGCGVT